MEARHEYLALRDRRVMMDIKVIMAHNSEGIPLNNVRAVYGKIRRSYR